jgi:Flp pilus assembly protein TadG
MAFRKDDGGSVIITFGMLAVIVVLVMGVALDFTRASFARQRLQSVLDASLLGIAIDRTAGNDSEIAAILSQRVLPDVAADGIEGVSIAVSRTDQTLSAHAAGRIKTHLLTIAQIHDLDVGVTAAVIDPSEPMEYALVLDTTGTMASDMPTLRSGAQALVDILTRRGSDSRARVALVPFVGSVNIGNGMMQEQWLDKDGLSQHAGQTVRGRWIGVEDSPACAGASVDDPVPARPRVRQTYPYVAERVGCYYANPTVVSNWHLFQGLTNVSWGGCVEARPEPYDIDDTPPGGDPDTRWVPFFALDELDPGVTGYPTGANDYLTDEPLPGTTMAASDKGRTFSVLKYAGRAAVGIDETPPHTNGPNKNCPDPIVPLTNDRDLVNSRMGQLVERFNGGTNTMEGIAWGLRVLSPGPPFTEGAAFGSVQKVMVLFSDGANAVAGQALGSDNNPSMPFISEYTAWGYARFGRFATQSAHEGGPHIDRRMAAACDLAKSKGIEIHVIAMGASEEAVERLQECASDGTEVIVVPRGADLTSAFQQLARKLVPVRLVR